MLSELTLSNSLLSFEATGTRWQILFSDETSAKQAQPVVEAQIETFSRVYSRFDKTSAIQQIAGQGGSVSIVHPQLLEFYTQLAECTGDLITPAVGEQLVAAGYDSRYSFSSRDVPEVQPWQELVSWTSDTLTVSQPIQLDFGAAGKGALVDRIADDLSELEWVSIDAGGDIRTNKVARVGLEDPSDPTQILGVVEINSQALCASSPNRRTWGKYHHIMNPARKASQQSEILATWVIADSTMHADGIATALFLVPPAALARFNFEYAILMSGNQLVQSPGFKELRRNIKGE